MARPRDQAVADGAGDGALVGSLPRVGAVGVAALAAVGGKLRKRVEAGEKYDLVILDPPKLVASQRDLGRGCRAYQDLARLGFMLTAPGGWMFNFSCSGLLPMELLEKITAAAALEAGVEARLAAAVRQGPDHPVDLAVPEGMYLKGRLNYVS